MTVIILILTLFIGVIIGYLIGNQKSSNARSEAELFKARLEQSQKLFDETMRLQKEHEDKSLLSLQNRFDETVAKMKAEIELVTGRLLKEREEELMQSNKMEMKQIIDPLNINLQQFRDAVNENTRHHSELKGQLINNLQLIIQHSDDARRSADRLTEALKGGGKIQGNWGETVLSELLASHGLIEGIHYDTQVTLHSNDRNHAPDDERIGQLRPDVVLHLDSTRDVVIDAKVSLTAFMDYVNADNEAERESALKKHIESLEKHVRELSIKDYSSHIQPPKKSVNYVIMFVPTTAAVYAATSAKPDLWRKAMEKGVYIADEQTLYSALKIIDLTWLHIAQAENHEKVFKLADEMLTRVASFIDNFNSIGNKLKEAENAYQSAFSKLIDNGQSIPVTCQKLIKMGAKPKKMPKGEIASKAFLPPAD